MTGVPAPAGQAEAKAKEQELDRVAWNLPRQPEGTNVHALRGSAPRDELATGRSKTTMPTLDTDRADHDATGQDLDWEGFVAAHFPGSRRHDLEAITAYGVYRRSGVFDEQATGVSRLKAAERGSTRATAVAAWEDEAGASP